MRRLGVKVRGFARGVAALAVAGMLGPTAVRAQDLSATALQTWLARYERAWETRSADAAAALFTETALYHEMPFDPPKVGRPGIREYWSTVTADQRDIDFRSDVIAVRGNTGVAHWAATFKLESTGAVVELDGMFVLEFDATGLCSSLQEWWHVRER